MGLGGCHGPELVHAGFQGGGVGAGAKPGAKLALLSPRLPRDGVRRYRDPDGHAAELGQGRRLEGGKVPSRGSRHVRGAAPAARPRREAPPSQEPCLLLQADHEALRRARAVVLLQRLVRSQLCLDPNAPAAAEDGAESQLRGRGREVVVQVSAGARPMPACWSPPAAAVGGAVETRTVGGGLQQKERVVSAKPPPAASASPACSATAGGCSGDALADSRCRWRPCTRLSEAARWTAATASQRKDWEPVPTRKTNRSPITCTDTNSTSSSGATGLSSTPSPGGSGALPSLCDMRAARVLGETISRVPQRQVCR